MALVQDFNEIYLRMQDRTLEIIGEKQIAAATYMQHRPRQFIELDIHKISHRIILNETARLHPHPEGVHLRQILIILRLYHNLSTGYSVAAGESLLINVLI